MVEQYFSSPMTPQQYSRLEFILASPGGVADFTPAEVKLDHIQVHHTL